MGHETGGTTNRAKTEIRRSAMPGWKMGGPFRGTVLAPSSQAPRRRIGLGGSSEGSDANGVSSLAACMRTLKTAVLCSVDYVVYQQKKSFSDEAWNRA